MEYNDLQDVRKKLDELREAIRDVAMYEDWLEDAQERLEQGWMVDTEIEEAMSDISKAEREADVAEEEFLTTLKGWMNWRKVSDPKFMFVF